MDNSTKLTPCTECSKNCKPVFAIVLIGLGVILLIGELQHTNDQK